MGVPRSSLLRLAVTVGWAAQAWGKIPMPFEYRGFDNFPASFFGADIHGVEADSEMALVAKHQVSGWGWQQGCMTSCCPPPHCNCETSNPVGCPSVPPPGYTPAAGHVDEEEEILKQATAFKAYVEAHSNIAVTQGIFAYRQVTYAAWWWRKNYDAYTNPATRKYFLRSASTGDFCWSNGPIWDFRNASARQYFINNVISEVTRNESSVLNLVFFDSGLGILGENPHPSPSGLIGGSNCSIAYQENATSRGGKDLNFTDAERVEAVQAQVQLLAEVAAALNAHSIVPMFSLAVPFDPRIAESRGFPGKLSRGYVFTEAEVVAALQNVTWMRYYEWFQSSGWSESIGMSVENVIEEVARGIPVVGHAYGKPENCSDPQDKGIGSAVAAFLIAQGNYTYFQTSSSVVGADPWTDAGWCWHPLYELKCGLPQGLATKTASGVWRREFANCSVTLDQRSNSYSIHENGHLRSGVEQEVRPDLKH
eukprot:m.96700 g.96700  ORF g.96700 m.96700 type:complete len:480 (-) comp12372_c0_seq1:2497-3936(-)